MAEKSDHLSTRKDGISIRGGDVKTSLSVRQVVCQKDDLWDKNVENLLLSPPGPQLLLQELQLPQTPHWHSELDGGADGPAGVGIDSDGMNCNYSTSVCFISTHY